MFVSGSSHAQHLLKSQRDHHHHRHQRRERMTKPMGKGPPEATKDRLMQKLRNQSHPGFELLEVPLHYQCTSSPSQPGLGILIQTTKSMHAHSYTFLNISPSFHFTHHRPFTEHFGCKHLIHRQEHHQAIKQCGPRGC
jgi:hypothetical protein